MRKQRNKRLKIIVLNSISAIVIVLLWFILYYIFENHGWLCSSKEECLLIHQNIDWEFWNMFAFFIVYFLIDLLNYWLTDLPFWNYALIQAILDFVLFSMCLTFMKKMSWFVPITGVNGFHNFTEVRVFVQYFQQYMITFFISYLIIAILCRMNVFTKGKKQFNNIKWLWVEIHKKTDLKEDKEKSGTKKSR